MNFGFDFWNISYFRKVIILTLFAFDAWFKLKSSWSKVEMGPDPTEPKEFFLSKGEKIVKFGMFKGNFPNPNPNQRWLSQPNPTRATKIDPEPYHYKKGLNYILIF